MLRCYGRGWDADVNLAMMSATAAAPMGAITLQSVSGTSINQIIHTSMAVRYFHSCQLDYRMNAIADCARCDHLQITV